MVTNFATITPDSGSGDATLTISATKNTGRNSRTVTISAREASGTLTSSNNLSISQDGAEEFITISSVGTAVKDGGNVNVIFTSNSRSFIARVGAPVGYSSQTPVIKSIDVNGSAVSISGTNNITVTPTGDPGATAQYTVTMVVTIPANTATSVVKYPVTITSTTTASINGTGNINQAGADKYLKFVNSNGEEISSISVDADGTAVNSARISSNIAWTLTTV
jgi:hypothetical protein